MLMHTNFGLSATCNRCLKPQP